MGQRRWNLQLIAALALAACPSKPAAPPPAPAAGTVEVNDPVPPPPVPPPQWPATAPTALSPMVEAPTGCTNLREVPSVNEWQQAQDALAGAKADDVELSVLADGCARLRQLRTGGKVLQWRLRRYAGAQWVTTADWQFVAGLERPTTIGRYSLAAAIDRPNEWVKEEIRRKAFTRYKPGGGVLDELVLIRYPGEPALYQSGAPPRKISSVNPTVHCRTDGTNHCDRVEQQDRWSIESDIGY